MKCLYKIVSDGGDSRNYSFSELITEISKRVENENEQGRLPTDLVFSKMSKRDAVVLKIKEKLKDAFMSKHIRSHQAVVDGQVDYVNNESIPINAFLESDEAVLGTGDQTKRLIVQKTDEEYLTNYIASRKEQGVSEEVAKAEWDTLQEHNDKIIEDSKELHQILTSKSLYKPNASGLHDFIQEFKTATQNNSRFENLTIPNTLFYNLRDAWIRAKGSTNESKMLTNINLEGKLNKLSRTILGHIDYLFVDERGTLHLFNYKVSHQAYKDWPAIKRRKYKLELVFLKYILANNGIDVSNITLNIIPVHVQYNQDFTKIENIVVENIRQESASARRAGEYDLQGYEKLVRPWLNNNYIPETIGSSTVKEATDKVKMLYPELNIKPEGIRQNAQSWIKTAPTSDPFGNELMIIEEVNEPDHRYNLVVRDQRNFNEVTTIPIKSDKPKEKNKELIDAVSKQLLLQADDKGYAMNSLKNAIKVALNKHLKDPFAELRGLPLAFTHAIFSKYVTPRVVMVGDEKEYVNDWELLEDLSDANILMFKHRNGQVDVIALSAFNLNSAPSLTRGSTVLGSILYDTQTDTFTGDYGNIELIKTMIYLNEAAPSFSPDMKFGKIQVINLLSKTQRSYSASYLNREQFSKVLRGFNEAYPGATPIKNNMNNLSYQTELDILQEEYLNIRASLSESQQTQYDSLGFTELFESIATGSSESYEYQLFHIMEAIYNALPDLQDPSKVVQIVQGLHTGSPKLRNYAKLLTLVSQAYQAVRGEQIVHQTELSTIDMLTFTALNVPDLNIRIVTENLQISNDLISKEFMDTFYGNFPTVDQSLDSIFENYFSAIGYSKLLTQTINNEASQFKNLYEIDNEGNLTMSFKNPYERLGDESYLTTAERTLLKKVLYALHVITTNGAIKFTSVDSKALIDYTKKHKEYFWVPLKKASRSTSRQNLKAWRTKWKHITKLVSNSKERIQEALDGLLEEEANTIDSGERALYLNNPFQESMLLSGPQDFETVRNKRQQMINKYGPEFFETNLRDLTIDYLFKSIATAQYNKLLISTRSLLIQLHLTGDYGGNQEVMNKEIKYIQEYLKVNVFGRSILEDKSKQILSYVQPVKSKVSNTLLMGNVSGMIRDTMQGLLENTVRASIKLNTNISRKNVTKAYMYVFKNSQTNPRAVNLLSKLCLRYRLSNTDVARISERAKTSRGGLNSWEDAAYSTLRSPDFLNRMTLFVAKAMEDGCWEAWSLDSEGNLKYEWKKDKRFDKLAAGATNDPEYIKQRALYFSLLRAYNQENPSGQPLDISTKTDLPSPYTNKDILAIRSVADNIYGSYDKSKKGMYENYALGIMFGMYTTWFNGIYNNYFGKAGAYASNQLEWVQDTDPISGKPLYVTFEGNIVENQFNKDGSENQPILKQVPIITQGIFPMMGTLYKVLKNDGKDALKQYLDMMPQEKANLKKLLSDLLMTAFYLLIFQGVLSGKYKDYKKDMKNHPLLQNLTIELLYKPSSRAFDSFMGPLNIVQYVGGELDPAWYSIPIQLIKDSWSTIIGEKGLLSMLAGNFGFMRSYKDTISAQLKK